MGFESLFLIFSFFIFLFAFPSLSSSLPFRHNAPPVAVYCGALQVTYGNGC